MKKAVSIYLALFSILSVLIGGCTSKGDGAPVVAPSSAAPIGAKDAVPAMKTVWTCPMHPQIRKDGPGQCPICGMTLVKADSGNIVPRGTSSTGMPDEHAPFQLTSGSQQMIGVKTGFAVKKPLFKNIEASGRLAFDPELYTAQTEYAEALREMERVRNSPLPDVKRSAERMVQSARLRLKILGLSDKQIARIGGSGEESNLLITKPGQSVWIYADIFEMDLPYVQAGQSAEITAGFLGGKTLAGKVVSVDRVINPASRTAKARILVSEGGTFLRPESYVDVTIHAPLGEQVTVPFDAVMDTGKQAWVFTLSGQGEFTPRLVHVKFYAGDDVAIENGLMGGEKIVTSANFLIDSESRLKGVNMASPSESEPGAQKKPALPSCPKGQHWDVSMAMCMPG